MDVGVGGRVVLNDGIDDRLGFLGRGPIVQINQRITIYGLAQYREIAANFFQV